MTTWQVLLGDVREQLATVPAGSVQTCVTSPPYWGLRDYGHDGQIGLEPTPDAYVANLVAVFREVKRVLRDDGTLWLNLGDSYNNAGSSRNGEGLDGKSRGWTTGADGALGYNARDNRHALKGFGIKHKDLVGIPWMVAFALRADGWYLRSDIVWHKPNPMPESVTDRPTKSHEYIFLLTKRPTYYYDADAIREEYAPDSVERVSRGRSDHHKWTKGPGNQTLATDISKACTSPIGRNKRSVWTVTTQPYPEAHFATYPEDLIEPCILAGTSEKGQCPACGSPWERVTVKGDADLAHQRACGGDAEGEYHGTARKAFDGTGAQNASAVKARILAGMRTTETTGWQPTCACEAGDPVPQTVLDPFTGSGTTGAVAVRHLRSFLGCELNPDYRALARRRIWDANSLFAQEVTA